MVAPNAICFRCEPEFSQPNIDPETGKYRCPGCGCRFDRAGAALWPPNVKWYRPQSFKSQCPHCGVFLRDKKIVNRTPAEIGGVVLLLIAAGFLPWRPGAQIVLLIVLGLVDFVRWRRARACVSIEEERYAVEE